LRYLKCPFPPVLHGADSFVVALKKFGGGNRLEQLDALGETNTNDHRTLLLSVGWISSLWSTSGSGSTLNFHFYSSRLTDTLSGK
jgi:hypothetical protein